MEFRYRAESGTWAGWVQVDASEQIFKLMLPALPKTISQKLPQK
jgi:hypothetical protein